MLRYSKRLLGDIRFWYKEIRLRRKENAELERIEDIGNREGNEQANIKAGLAYYQTIMHNRAERKRLHDEQRITK